MCSTPPVSHMIPRDLHLNDVTDVNWTCLTSDPSIQILHLESPTSYGGWNKTACGDVHSAAKEKFDRFLRSRENMVDETRSLVRHCNSESDMIRLGLVSGTARSQGCGVARSKSVSYASRAAAECKLLQPLVPNVNAAKVSGVKRIPSFRDNPASQMGHGCVAPQKIQSDNKESCKRKGLIRYTASCRLSNADSHRLKIAKLVKHGLKSLYKTTECIIDAQATSTKNVSPASLHARKEHRKRTRKMRLTNDIGGLSEFLRKNEKRKSLASYPDAVSPRVFMDAIPEELNKSRESDDISSAHALIKARPVRELKYTPKPWTNSLEAAKAIPRGTCNFKCNRRLKFENNLDQTNKGPYSYTRVQIPQQGNSCFITSAVQTIGVNKMTSSSVQPSTRPLRPRLGVLKKPVTILPIDALDVDVVCDLKRQIKKINRVSRIKTNGSLKRHTTTSQRRPPHVNPWIRMSPGNQHVAPISASVYWKRESVL